MMAPRSALKDAQAMLRDVLAVPHPKTSRLLVQAACAHNSQHGSARWASDDARARC